MRTVLIVFLIALAIVQQASACGKKRKGKGGKPGPAAAKADVLKRKVGSDVTDNPFGGAGDNPGDCTALACADGGSSCCWNNAANDDLQFNQGTGAAEDAKMQTNFGTATKPDGTFLETHTQVAGSGSQKSVFYSCPITCANGDITVKVRHWQTKGVKLEVCSLSDPAGEPSNCQPLPDASGNQDTVTLPKGENTRVAIRASGFSTPDGDVAMLDKIEVACDPCSSTTQPTSAAGPTEAGATPAPAGAPPCKQIVCDFEAGNTCSYSPGSGGGNAAENWGVKEPIYQNRLTGITKANQGQKFAGCYTKKKSEKSTLETDAPFDSDYVVRYDFYEATEGVSLKCCCNDESSCPAHSDTEVQTSDYRTWKTGSVTCPKDSKKVIFVCENEKGSSEGACGLDNVQLMKSAGGAPEQASESAC